MNYLHNLRTRAWSSYVTLNHCSLHSNSLLFFIIIITIIIIIRIRLTFVIKFSRKTNAERFRRFDDILSSLS